MKRRITVSVLLPSLFALVAVGAVAAEPSSSRRPVILAHYMPWFQAPPASQSWGWHWTMNVFDPATSIDGRRAIASHFYPLIGPYDSGDPHVLEYHLLTMKMAGIDGVIVDWYGLQDFRDYPVLHRNTQRLVDQVQQAEMKFAICYEDQTIPALVDAGRLIAAKRVEHAADELAWLAKHWFTLENYVRLDGRPLLLSFGQSGLSDEEWSQCLAPLNSPPAYFSEHHRRTSAVGAFDWPVPSEGLDAIARFQKSASSWPHSIPAAFPRFIDIYAEAKLHESYGRIEDNAGATFRTSMQQALESNAAIIQITTWNDWGEGTCVEPSREFGFRDLLVVQELRRKHVDRTYSGTAEDLQLPLELLKQRRAKTTPAEAATLDTIAKLIAAGETVRAKAELHARDTP